MQSLLQAGQLHYAILTIIPCHVSPYSPRSCLVEEVLPRKGRLTESVLELEQQIVATHLVPIPLQRDATFLR